MTKWKSTTLSEAAGIMVINQDWKSAEANDRIKPPANPYGKQRGKGKKAEYPQNSGHSCGYAHMC